MGIYQSDTESFNDQRWKLDQLKREHIGFNQKNTMSIYDAIKGE
jgi:hypothetical protein